MLEPEQPSDKKMNYKIKTIIILSICAISSFLPAARVVAVSTTPTPSKAVSPTVNETLNEKLNSQINLLKDKIASRVSELNLVEKRGITGDVTDASTNKITLTDTSGATLLIDVDEITKFSSSSATFGLSDLKKGTKINILGLYNKQSKRILARFITTAIIPTFLSGGISEIDSNNFTIKILSENKKSTTIDIGSATKISQYTKEDGLSKIVFAKLNIGDRITVIGYPDKKDSSLIIGQRLIVLSGVPKDPKISITIPSPTVVPTTPVLPVKKLQIITPVVTIPVITNPAPTVAR